MLFVQNSTEEEVAKYLGFKTNERKRSAGYKQIKNLKKIFQEKAKLIIKEKGYIMIKLSEEQKQRILEQFQKDPSIIKITRAVFNNNDLDGRSKEGRSVIKFLAENGLKIQTTKHEKAKEVNLNVDQTEQVIDMAEKGMNTSEIADILFEKRVKRLSNEWKSCKCHTKSKRRSTKRWRRRF